jgi:hypothetical protein
MAVGGVEAVGMAVGGVAVTIARPITRDIMAATTAPPIIRDIMVATTALPITLDIMALPIAATVGTAIVGDPLRNPGCRQRVGRETDLLQPMLSLGSGIVVEGVAPVLTT